jgi:hypothetical protein
MTAAVDCKYYTREIDVKKVDEFIGYIEDVQADIGILVTTNKEFTPAARRQREAGELETATLLAAAVDATVGGDLLFALREEARAEHPEIEVPAAVEDETPSSEERERIDALFDLAERVFPEIAGAAPDPTSPEVRTERAIEELLGSAIPVAAEFGTGVLSAGAGTMVAALGPLEPIRNVVARAGGRLLHGSRLLANAVEKLVGLLAMESEAGIDIGLEEIGDALSSRINALEEQAVRKVVRVQGAKRRIEDLLEGREVGGAQLEALDTELNDLCQDFRGKMALAAKIRKGIRFGAPALIVVGAGVAGKAAVSAAYGVGLTYCLLALAVRLDTVPGWIRGVPTILEQALGPAIPRFKIEHYEI